MRPLAITSLLVAGAACAASTPPPSAVPASGQAEAPDPDGLEPVSFEFDDEGRMNAWVGPVEVEGEGSGERVSLRWDGEDGFSLLRASITRTATFVGDAGQNQGDYTLRGEVEADVALVHLRHGAMVECYARLSNGVTKQPDTGAGRSWTEGAERVDGDVGVIMTPRGQVALEYSNADEPPPAQYAFHAVPRAAIVPWPKEPVGVGARWTTRQLTMRGSPRLRHHEVDLVAMTADTVTVRVRTYTVRLVRLVDRQLQFLEGDEGWDVIWGAFREKYRNDLLHIRASTHEVEDRTVVLDRTDPIGVTVSSTETAQFKGSFAKERGGKRVPGVFTVTETVVLTPAKGKPD